MKTFLLCILALLLTACATTPQLPLIDPEQAWQARRETLSSLDSWSLVGRIAIQTEEQGWHASLRWRQQGESYDININAPLGQGAARLQGDESGVILRTSEGKEYAADAQTLLDKRLGWRLPVVGLRYWILGLPESEEPFNNGNREFDELGRLTWLSQSGWDIAFRDYTEVGELALPQTLFLSNQEAQLEVRLAVERWSELR